MSCAVNATACWKCMWFTLKFIGIRQCQVKTCDDDNDTEVVESGFSHKGFEWIDYTGQRECF